MALQRIHKRTSRRLSNGSPVTTGLQAGEQQDGFFLRHDSVNSHDIGMPRHEPESAAVWTAAGAEDIDALLLSPSHCHEWPAPLRMRSRSATSCVTVRPRAQVSSSCSRVSSGIACSPPLSCVTRIVCGQSRSARVLQGTTQRCWQQGDDNMTMASH